MSKTRKFDRESYELEHEYSDLELFKGIVW